MHVLLAYISTPTIWKEVVSKKVMLGYLKFKGQSLSDN